MSFFSLKTISILVGLLHMGVSLGLPLYYYIKYLFYHYTENEDSKDEDFDITDMKHYYPLLALLPFVFWFILSFLMVTGIVKKRHCLMAPWVYLHYLGFIAVIGFMFSQFILAVGMGGSLKKGLPILGVFSAFLFGLILCHYPVQRLYRQMKKPVTILPTQCIKYEIEEENGEEKSMLKSNF